MDDLETLIEKLVAQLGYELVDFETINGGQLLRIYIDKDGLVNIEDCTTVSNHVNNVLSVETDFDYERLEVSSPGLDRVIKKLKDFDRFKGQQAKIKTRFAIDNRKNFKGTLSGIKGEMIMIKTEDELLEIDFENIDKARLDPNY
ncbi:MAG: ribosome maturation factor RimP [Nitrosomonadales bacterium]|nr:ribosome maturation factor RimP [Nitrosomonadales bacterium]MBT6817799.1 ribosome maturation factor RimP [Nitrosomonadales bacterium]MBT7120935.1 ribosome maturation factor RimP [Nitrosomonadales bacterium]MBT7407030.1 ribosome maturation factor RimP [Nitrosomonadales bacterium]MBT7689773.1 ribosome maturation factor RimP [Nitrosomonadales bacterium]